MGAAYGPRGNTGVEKEMDTKKALKTVECNDKFINLWSGFLQVIYYQHSEALHDDFKNRFEVIFTMKITCWA